MFLGNKKEIFWWVAGFATFFILKYFLYDNFSDNWKNNILVFWVLGTAFFVFVSFVFIPIFYVKIKKRNHRNLKSDIKKIIKDE